MVVCGADGLSDPARRAGVRVLGPESFGIAVPGIGLNASRAHLPPPAGRIGLVSQSASLCRTVLDWAQPNGVGFSHIVGIGAPRGYRLRPGAGLAVARSRHRRDPARHQAVAGPARLPLRRPRRVAAASGGGASPGRCARRPQRRLGTRLRGGAAPGRRAVRRQPRGPAGGSRNPRPRPAGPQRGAEHRHQRDRRRTDGGGRGAARRAATGGRHRPRGAGRFYAFGRAGRQPLPRHPASAASWWCTRRPARTIARRPRRSRRLATQRGCRSWSAPWARPPVPPAGAAWPKPAWRCSPRPNRPCVASCIW